MSDLAGRVVCVLGGAEAPLPGPLRAALEERGATVVSRAPSTPAEHAAAVDETLALHGRVDALVSCPAAPDAASSLLDVEPGAFAAAVEARLTGLFTASQAAARAMVAARGGLIVHVVSTDGLEGRAGRGVRAACHHGVVGLSQALADEVRRHGVKVVPLFPEDDAGLEPRAIAELVVFLLAQPPDTVLLGGVISPVGSRRRKR